MDGIDEGSSFYFVHSYCCDPAQGAHRLASSEYGTDRFSSVISMGSIYGCQFHPERSGRNGLRILENFLFRV